VAASEAEVQMISPVAASVMVRMVRNMARLPLLARIGLAVSMGDVCRACAGGAIP
jgi:hypothetical protein